MIFFLNGEFLCFTLLSNLVKRILCQTLRKRANLEKTNLIIDMLNNVSMLHFSLTQYMLWYIYQYIERQRYIVWST